MKNYNLKSNGRPRLGRPTGPTKNRGSRPWDKYDAHAILTVFANQDLPRWVIAEGLGMSLSKLSTITCSPQGVAMLERLEKEEADKLLNLKTEHLK